MQKITLIKTFNVSIILCALFTITSSAVSAQTAEDSIMTKLNALRDDYIGKIKAMGYTPSLKAPVIILDNPRSYGNYDDKNNILHMGDWKTLPAEAKGPFNGFASMIGNGMTAEKFFNLAVHKWILFMNWAIGGGRAKNKPLCLLMKRKMPTVSHLLTGGNVTLLFIN